MRLQRFGSVLKSSKKIKQNKTNKTKQTKQNKQNKTNKTNQIIYFKIENILLGKKRRTNKEKKRRTIT